MIACVIRQAIDELVSMWNVFSLLESPENSSNVRQKAMLNEVTCTSHPKNEVGPAIMSQGGSFQGEDAMPREVLSP